MNSDPQYAPMMIDDTIDLRPYILGLFRFWPALVGVPALAVVLSVLVIFVSTPVYEAKVGVAIVSYQTTFAREEPSEAVMETVVETVAEPAAQRAALVDLAQNPGIAREVIARLGDALPQEYRDVARLTKVVKASARESDLVEIVVTARDPEVAMMVAQSWAAAYEEHINNVFSGIAPGAVEATRAQAEMARREYEAAEEALIAYAAENPAAELSREIDGKQQALDAMRDGRVREVSDVVYREPQVRRLLADARALLTVAQEGGNAAAESSALALALLKTEAYASSPLPGGLTLEAASGATGPLDAAGQARDLRALIAALEAELEELATTREAILAAGGSVYAAESAEGVAALEADLRSLQAQREGAAAKDRELRRARDQSWETYTALTRKLAEQRVEGALTRNVVRVASEPLFPEEPARRSLVQTAALAAVGSGAVTVLAIFFVIYLYPDYDPSTLWRRRAPEEPEAVAGDASTA